MTEPETKGAEPMATQKTPRHRPDQEGMALILALMVLLVLTVIGAALMANVNTETKISGLKVRDTQALTLAEAGVQEALMRLRTGEVTDDNNPRRVTVIFNQVAGSIPPVGADTTALPTLQPAGSWLPYSTAGKSPSMLSVRYKTKANVIQRYDPNANPMINGATGNPIFQITSTGTSGSNSRTIYAEVCRSTMNVITHAAVAGDVALDFTGNINVCGHDHRGDTPNQTGPPGCDGVYPGGWWSSTVHTSCLPGAWSTGAVSTGGSSDVDGEPAPTQGMQTGFYSGPWDVFGMTQAEFWAWVGPPVTNIPTPAAGIYYLDNNGTKQDRSGTWGLNGSSGEGFLYVDGDLHVNGGFTFRGMIYVEGDFKMNGNAWILGGLVVKGGNITQVKMNGSAILLYSSEAIQQKISKYGGSMKTIAWREL